MKSNIKELEISGNGFQRSQIGEINVGVDGGEKKLGVRINGNGFTMRPTLYQIVPIVYVVFMTMEVTGVIALIMQQRLKIVFGLGYAILLIVVSVMWYITTKIDPTDSIQLVHRRSVQKKKEMKSSYFRFFCHICQTCVSKNSYHCRSCNRCVQCFDHHCKWLNNCIGAKNYLQFFILIIMTQIFVLLHSGINMIDICQGIKEWKQEKKFHWIFYVSIAFMAINIIILGFNSVLVGIHIYLAINKKSTIQFIMEKRKISKIHPFEQPNLDQNIQKGSVIDRNERTSVDKISKSQLSGHKLKISTMTQDTKNTVNFPKLLRQN